MGPILGSLDEGSCHFGSILGALMFGNSQVPPVGRGEPCDPLPAEEAQGQSYLGRRAWTGR